MPSTETQLFDSRPFEAARLSVLAYARGFTLWHYHAPQMPLGTVASDGFLRDAADMLAAGDMVLVSAGDGVPGAPLCGRRLVERTREPRAGGCREPVEGHAPIIAAPADTRFPDSCDVRRAARTLRP